LDAAQHSQCCPLPAWNQNTASASTDRVSPDCLAVRRIGLAVAALPGPSRKRLKVLVATLSTPRMVTYSRKAHRDEQNDESEPYPPCCGHVDRVSASHAALCTARHGVRSHPVPVALVGECSIPVV